MPPSIVSRLGPGASDCLLAMAEAALRGGAEARQRLRPLQPAEITLKGARDYQTEADRAVEAVIAGHLARAFPAFGLSGEEQVADRPADAGAAHFVVDPIDGTTNFAWGIPHFGVVISLVQGGAVTAGVVYDPMQDELFSAERGDGAYLDGRRLRVRAVTDIDNTVMGASLPVPGQVRSVPVETYHAALRRLMDHVAGLRRFGSAALSIAYVAAGRLDGFFEDGLSLHDYGASKLIVEEAGGRVTGFTGEPVDDRGAILAAAPGCHDWLVEGFR